jgi:hypothetical protein
VSLHDLNERIEALEQEFGNSEGEPWSDERAAEEYEDLSDWYQLAWDVLLVDKLSAVGEQEIADFYRSDPDEYSRRYAAGQEQFGAKLRIHSTRSSDDLVSVASFVNVSRADLARNVLESEGIRAALANVNLVLWQWEYSNATGGVTVQVRRGDAPHAHALLTAPCVKMSEARPPWTCSSCGQRIAGDWDVCWRCGDSTDVSFNDSLDDQASATPPGYHYMAAAQQLTRIIVASIVVLFVLLPLAVGALPLALVSALFVGILIYFMGRFALFSSPAGEGSPALDSERVSSSSFTQTKSEVSKAIVRRAWQASVLGAFGFPPLGFYSIRLLWRIAGRNTPLGTADRWRVTLAFILSLVAILYCFLFVALLTMAFFTAFARIY